MFDSVGLTPEAESLLGLLLKLNCKPEVSTISSMIYLYGKQNQLERANQVFKAVADSSSERKHLCNSMIDVYVKSAKVDDAYLFFKEETEKGHDVGAIAISMLVNALTSCGKNEIPNRILLIQEPFALLVLINLLVNHNYH